MKAHGLRGEVVVELITNRTERVAPGSTLTGDGGLLQVIASRPFQATGRGRWIVAFAGVDDRPAADALRGTLLRAEPLQSAEGLWVHQLIGAQVVDTAGSSLGTVVAVEANPASDLLVLDGGALVPLRFVEKRDGTYLVVDPPAGLLDL